jgi:hypothetical protein
VNRTRKELIAAQRAIAVAKVTVFHCECERLAHLAAEGVVDRVEAADKLYDMAVSNRLVHIHGDDFIGEILAAAFEWAPVWSASKGSAA